MVVDIRIDVTMWGIADRSREEIAEKTDSAGSAVLTECVEQGTGSSITSDTERFDFVKLFEEDPPAEDEPISPISGNTSNQKATDSRNRS
uniref:Uncharacterized protein n=1 Tax=Parascaris equorum TaxID=6256 RepID=A0A914RWZ2_PAREQ